MKIKYHILVLFLITLFSYSNATTPCSNINIIGSFDSSQLSFAFGERVIISQDKTRAFLSEGGAGLQIIDITDLTNPTLIGNYDVNYTIGEIVKEVVLSSEGNKMFVASSSGGLKVVDISNQANPILLGENNLTNGLALGVAISSDDSIVYVADYSGGLKIVDVSNPINPTVVSELNSSVIGVAKNVVISADGTKAFVSTSSTGLRVVNISDPSNPILLSGYNTSYAQHVTISSDETKAFVSDSDKGIKILDISDPMNITLVSTLDINGTAMQISLSEDNSKAVVVDLNRGVKVIDISDIGNPTILNSFSTRQARGVTFSTDNNIFVADGHGGLKVLECTPSSSTPPTTPSTPSVIPTTTSYSTRSTTTTIPTIDVALRPNSDTLDDSGEICLGNRVWDDINRDGIQNIDELGVEDVKVTLYSGDCITELNTTRTDVLGEYIFRGVVNGDYCIGFSDFPIEYENYIATFKNQDSNDSRDSDVNRDTNKTDRFTINNVDNNECNSSFDMGIYIKRDCEELVVYDDIFDSNKNDSITDIDVLSNDILSSNGGEIIKFLRTTDGETLWNEGGIVPSNIELLDVLVVEGEGVWSVEEGEVKFLAYDEFDGQTPSIVYYTVQTPSCDGVVDSEIRLSNVAEIKLSSPCSCQKGYKDSVSSLNKIGVVVLIILSTILSLWFIMLEFKKEEYLNSVR